MHPQLLVPLLLMFWVSNVTLRTSANLTNIQPYGYLMCVRQCLNTGGCACIMYKVSETRCIVHTRLDQCKNNTEIFHFSNTSHCGERVCSKREVCLITNQGDNRCAKRYSPSDAADESRTTGESKSPEHKVQDRFHQHLNVTFSCGHAELLYTKFKFDASSVNPDCSVDPKGRLFSIKIKNGINMKGNKLKHIYGAFSNVPVTSKSAYTAFTVAFNFPKKLKDINDLFNIEIGLCSNTAILYKAKSVTACSKCLGFLLEKAIKLDFYDKNFNRLAERQEMFPRSSFLEREYLSFTFLFDKKTKTWFVYSYQVDTFLTSFKKVRFSKLWPIVSIITVKDGPTVAESVSPSLPELKAVFQKLNCP